MDEPEWRRHHEETQAELEELRTQNAELVGRLAQASERLGRRGQLLRDVRSHLRHNRLSGLDARIGRERADAARRAIVERIDRELTAG